MTPKKILRCIRVWLHRWLPAHRIHNVEAYGHVGYFTTLFGAHHFLPPAFAKVYVYFGGALAVVIVVALFLGDEEEGEE